MAITQDSQVVLKAILNTKSFQIIIFKKVNISGN